MEGKERGDGGREGEGRDGEGRGNQSKRLRRKGKEGTTGVPVNACCGVWGMSLGSRNRTALGRSVLGLKTGPHEGDQSWVSK